MKSPLLSRMVKGSPMGTIGLCLMVILVLLALFATILSPENPLEQDLSARNKPPGWEDAKGRAHYLGTDYLGRDILSRMLFGLRISMLIGFGAVMLAAILGIGLGVIAGYAAGPLDAIIMRIVDIQLSFPFILLAIVWVAFIGSGLWHMILIIALVRGWVDFARVVRGEVLSAKELNFVEAAKALGASHSRILLRHILPQVVAPILVIATLMVGRAIVMESTLGFLGLGVPPPSPTLGGMLSDGRSYIQSAWWLVTFPGLLIMLIVLSANTMGDGLRDVLDPKLKR
ncbi:MAG: ABC transporter permease [Desulfobacteraceae bacterium]|nr:MAG: ABC transporter permease [Desulfobacteraceae bacterium]